MGLLQDAGNLIRNKIAGYLKGGVPLGRVVYASPSLDTWTSDVTYGLTFDQVRGYLQAADSGQLAEALRMFEEFEQRDPYLASVASTRRLAVTGLEYEIVSAADVQDNVGDRVLADMAAAYCRDELSRIECFDEALEHLATGIGPNLAVLEIIWNDRGRVEDLVAVPSHRLRMDYGVDFHLRIITEDDAMGVPALGPKWVIHVHYGSPSHPLQRAISRTCAMTWLVKHLGMAGWAVYCQKFGMPIRWGTYQQGADEKDIARAKEMLAGLGSNAWAVFSSAIDVKLLESSQRGTQPYQELLHFVNRELAIAFLGGHLTVDTAGATGTHAAGEVQNEVRGDIRDDDVRREARTIRRQLLTPMVRYHLGPGVPVPYFRRVLPETREYINDAELMRKVSQDLGLPIETDWAYRTLGIPKPSAGADGRAVPSVITRIAASPFEGDGGPLI